MKKHTKFLALGAISALTMGVFAVSKPAMAANLLPLDATRGTSADVTIKVIVAGEAPTINIENPLDGAVFIGKEFPVSISYTDSSSLEYELIHVAKDGTKTTYNLPTDVISEEGVSTGVKDFMLNVDNYGGKFGQYILNAKAIGSGTAIDSVSFKIILFDFYVKGIEEDTNNPIITIPENPDVYKALIQIFDEDGNAIFDEPVEQVLTSGADTDVTLPLAKYGVPEGTYRILATPYDKDGNIIDLNVERTVKYKPAPAPEVPDTGGFLGSLNLSRQDMVSTGLALLFVCGFFGILLIVRKNKADKRH